MTDGYFPIIDQDPAASEPQVIGFGRATINSSPGVVRVTKISPAGGYVAAANATADLSRAWTVAGISDFVRQSNASLKDALLAPVLARTLGD
jgi:hypothetical protein